MKNMKRYIALALTSTILLSMSVTSVPSTAGNCGSDNPEVSTDCTTENGQQTYCCYMTPTNGGASFCNTISPPMYLPSMTTYDLEGTDYNIDCDIVEGTEQTPCGVVGPNELSDCTEYSTDTNSCCYYNLNDNRICVWAGNKLFGNIVTGLDCGSNHSSYISTFTLILALLYSLIM
jgi:hypothetical protein